MENYKPCPRLHKTILVEIMSHDQYQNLPSDIKDYLVTIQCGFFKKHKDDGDFLRNVWNHLYNQTELQPL